jgi:hypothetical protein
MKWEDYEEIGRMVREQNEKYKPEQTNEDFFGDCDYIWAPEKGMATVIYILVMVFGSIFHARVLLWIVATVIYFNLPCMNTKK